MKESQEDILFLKAQNYPTLKKFRKKQLHKMLNQGFQESYEGKTTRIIKND